MLESGYTVFDCQIVKPLSENKIYQSYLVSCSDSRAAKLFVLLPDPLFDQQQQQACIDRASWLSSQTIPGIGLPLHAGLIDGQLAYLYPYPQGESLSLDSGSNFTVRQSVDLIKKITASLSAAHSAGLWHGNLSPENIFSDTELSYLAEFSLNQLIRLGFHSGIDPRYTSPEQVRGEVPGSAADIYSLGCIFYHLLTGAPPFEAEEPFAIAKQHLQDEFPPLPEELKILQPVLTSMTAAAVEDRITIDELLGQINMLSELQELDHISFQNIEKAKTADEPVTIKSSSLLDEALSSSEIAARIEERLKEHAVDFQESEVFDNQLEKDNIDVVSELDQGLKDNKIGFGRIILILLLGVVIGSGLYFLFGTQGVDVSPVTVESTAASESTSMAGLDRGLQLWQEDDFNGAEAEFKEVISIRQEDPKAYNNLAAFYAAQGNYSQARDYLEQALATDERYATIYRNLGSVYAEMARGSYGRALQLDRVTETVYLPVFSSRGVVKLKSASDVAIKTLVPEPEIATDIDTLAEAGERISAAGVKMTEKPTDLALVTPGEKVLSTAIKGTVDPQAKAPELPIVEPNQVATVEKEESTDVTPDLQPENARGLMVLWAEAWSSQNVDAYLSFYGEKFVPPAGRSREDWEALRRSRILAPKEILVTLSDFQVNLLDNGLQRIEVVQDYKSNLLADRFKKVFDLQQTDIGWEIIRERSLGRVR